MKFVTQKIKNKIHIFTVYIKGATMGATLIGRIGRINYIKNGKTGRKNKIKRTAKC